MYRRLSSASALSGLLRIRTSSEFRVARSFGQLYPDDRYDNLAHIVACDPTSSFAFDFEFTGADGFAGFPDNPPMLQMAFQYHMIVPIQQPLQEDAKDGTEQAIAPR